MTDGPHIPPSSSAPKPKGILKNPSGDAPKRANLTWDEQNLSEHDVESGKRMKITEPKTPFVRYNPETDEVMDLDKIPGFELGQAEPYTSSSPGPSSPSSRRSSDAKEKMVRTEEPAIAGLSDSEPEDESQREKKRQFAMARGSHYRNEAEAMRKAQELMEEEEDNDDEDDSSEEHRGGVKYPPPMPPLPSDIA